MRVPMLLHCPELTKGGGKKLNQVIANVDIAPTFLEAAGLRAPKNMDGKSFLPLLKGENVAWRNYLLYEYYWERNFPQTPTMHALRGDRYKYIHYHGIWDSDELYDLQNDPLETTNLIRSADHQAIVKEMNKQLFDMLAETQGLYLPLYPDRGGVQNLRRKTGAKVAEFPPELIREEKR
jgi:N-acetylglucosamine-6-sulfatase